VTYNNESNIITVDKIIVLMQEIAVFKSRLTDVINDQNVALKVTLGVLESRVQELRERISD
tara:strand:+ start:136 stop:318 length:183 start_codon:yes stop_codon:yes gene_type:complete